MSGETTVHPEMLGLYPETLDCVHCGLCLTACPTYRATGRETSSPRGRIYLMRGVAEGRIPLSGTVAEEAYLCLGCRACETACPAGVAYGSLLEHTRAAVEAQGLRDGLPKRIESSALRNLVPHPRRLHWAMSALAAVQHLALDRVVRPLLPKRLREMHALLPKIPASSERGRLPRFTPANGERRGRVAMFEGCIMPEMFGRVNAATVRVLAACGLEVVSPEGQGCCGALQAHGGELEFARALARSNLAAFDPEDFDSLVVGSAGCGASLRELGDWLPGEGDALAAKVRDVSEVIVEAGIPADLNRVAGTVCYDDPCHLIHGQGVSRPPRAILEAIPGLELVQHDDPGSCCGAAGIYNLTQPEMSRTVLARKMDALAALDPDFIATGNPGCMMQLATGVKQRGLRAEVVHPVELLDRALSSA